MNWIKLTDLRGDAIFVNIDRTTLIRTHSGATGLATQNGSENLMVAIVKETPEEIFAAISVRPFEIKKTVPSCVA